MVLFNALTSIGMWDKPTRLVLCSIKFSCNCLDCVLLRLRILWSMAWKWIRISLDSWMVVLVDMVQYCTVSYIPGAQGGSQFFGLSDLLFWCGDITVRININNLYC
jgi:hypothetical protein